MKIQRRSTTRHYRGYTLPFNFRALDLEHRYLKWIRESSSQAYRAFSYSHKHSPSQKCWHTWYLKHDTREVADDPCFFTLNCSSPQNGTAILNCMSPEYDERLARSSQSLESLQGESSTRKYRPFFFVDTKALPGSTQNSRNPKDSRNRLSLLTMRRLNRLSALDNVTIFVTNSEHAQRHFPAEDFVRYARGIKGYVESRMLQRFNPIPEFSRLLSDLVLVVALAIVSFFELWGLTSPIVMDSMERIDTILNGNIT
ncbi:uncharacterized protein EAF02_004277 [Botrytis sinoallii]|uniref:uncharacterized protein n=1 Tax=Botrytis sinoallii TaxID=1463999 RepID=UPI001901B027|nr:uncharacterized protein EAF02_004277 [Botrytis sinoallii]KAF7885768.1 hypothetical protein EAF02_004277 [Botrytis sinoallii]